MACYFCFQKLGNIKVAVGWGKEVHPECYEDYLRFIKQIKEAHHERQRDA